MYEYETNTCSEDSIRQMVLEHTQAGEVYLHELSTGPSKYPRMDMAPHIFSHVISSYVAPLDNLNEILQGTAASEFTDLKLITDFSGEPYEVLKVIPITIRSLDEGGIETVWKEGNIAWVDDSRVEAINGLKAEILDTMESFEANEARLGPEPKRQLVVLRTHLKHIP